MFQKVFFAVFDWFILFVCEGERRGDAGQKTASTGTAAAKTLQTLLYILTLP